MTTRDDYTANGIREYHDRIGVKPARPMRHSWGKSDTCQRCGLHREGAGYGPYGAMRYWRDGENGYSATAGVCKA